MTRLARTLVASALIAGGLFAALATPATAASTGAVHGKVTSGGVVVKGLKVELMHSSGQDDVEFPGPDYGEVDSDNTNTDGTYAFAGLKIGDNELYGLRISDPKGWHTTTYIPFVPRPGKTLRLNVDVHAAGKLSGRVVRADGASPSEITVDLGIGSSPDDDGVTVVGGEGGTVAADGSFQFRGVLPLDTYKVRFVDGSGKYLDQCFDHVALEAYDSECYSASVPATAVSVHAGGTTTLDDQTLSHLAGHINGTVTDTFGHALKGVMVRAVPASEPSYTFKAASTRSTSRFSIGGLPSGQYKIQVTDPKGVWAREWYDNTTMTPAHVFDLADGQTIGGLAIELRSRAAISAKATGGVGTITTAISVRRMASTSRPSGTVTVTCGSRSKTMALSGGLATVKLTGIPAGVQELLVSYSGAGSTAPGAHGIGGIRVK